MLLAALVNAPMEIMMATSAFERLLGAIADARMHLILVIGRRIIFQFLVRPIFLLLAFVGVPILVLIGVIFVVDVLGIVVVVEVLGVVVVVVVIVDVPGVVVVIFVPIFVLALLVVPVVGIGPVPIVVIVVGISEFPVHLVGNYCFCQQLTEKKKPKNTSHLHKFSLT